MPTERKANGIPRGDAAVGQALDDFRADLAGQIGGALERILRTHKAEAVAGRFDRKRSTVYRWAADPSDVPVSALLALSELEPGPEFLLRGAGILLSHGSSRALAHE